MNSTQAKQLSLPDIMSRLGYEPTLIKKGGNEYWYKSPFRDEKDASFHTSFLGGKWIWKDFGDRGGTVVDFVMQLKGLNQVGDALQFLEKMYRGRPFSQPVARSIKETRQQTDLFSFQQQENLPPEAAALELEFIEAHEIRNPLIHSYLTKERAIPRRLADLYLKEIKYRNKKNERDYFAFGMENESGGYEIRAASDSYSFKSALVKRDITVIRGKSPEKKAVSIFEGMTDFLSLLAMMNISQLSGDAVVMHSLSSFQRTVDFIKSQDYTTINTFLDNDKSGEEHTEKFKAEFGDRVAPQNSLFTPYADINDALKANQIPNFLQR